VKPQQGPRNCDWLTDLEQAELMGRVYELWELRDSDTLLRDGSPYLRDGLYALNEWWEKGRPDRDARRACHPELQLPPSRKRIERSQRGPSIERMLELVAPTQEELERRAQTNGSVRARLTSNDTKEVQ
jgi:hypothetical protein